MLDIIISDMLVVVPPKGQKQETISEEKPQEDKKRIECMNLAAKLRPMTKRKPDDEYFTKPHPSRPNTAAMQSPAVTIDQSPAELVRNMRRSLSRTFPPARGGRESPRHLEIGQPRPSRTYS